MTQCEISRLHGELTAFRIDTQLLKEENADPEVIREHEIRALQKAMELKATVEASRQ